MLIFTNVREIIVGILAFLLWGWLGLLVAFLALFLLNIFEAKVLAWLARRIKW